MTSERKKIKTNGGGEGESAKLETTHQNFLMGEKAEGNE